MLKGLRLGIFKKDTENDKVRPKICLSVSAEEICDGARFEEYIRYADMLELRGDIAGNAELMDADRFGDVLFIAKKIAGKRELIVSMGSGNTGMDDAKANKLLKSAVQLADYIDVDITNEQFGMLLREAHRKDKKVIASYHNYDRMLPKDEIAMQFLKLEKTRADVLKIACMANTEADTYEILEGAAAYIQLKSAKPIIAIAMGHEGQVSRICAGDFGSVITYACAEEPTAPGQFNVRNLKKYMDRYYETAPER